MSVSLVGILIGHFPSCMGGFISLSVCTIIGSGPLTMVAGPIVGKAIGGPKDNDNVMLGIANPGGPPLDAPCPSPWWGRRRRKKNQSKSTGCVKID